MLFKIMLLFTIVPFIELSLLLKIAQVTNFWTTVTIVFLTGVVGAYLAKSEGRIILFKIKRELTQGKMPGSQLINGLCVLIGGAFLVSPGILTDILGLTLVLPSTRNAYKTFIKNRFSNMIKRGTVNFYFGRLK